MMDFKNNTSIDIDNDGYLKDSTQWNESLAEVLAARENIVLSADHWEVVRFVRNFYLEFNISPSMRMLTKAMANSLGQEKGSSLYLYRLFPKGHAQQITKISGLPKTVQCI